MKINMLKNSFARQHKWLLHQCLLCTFCFTSLLTLSSQAIQDDFEGNGNITTWMADECGLTINKANPYKQGINTSDRVLEYNDSGGQYANITFDAGKNLDLYSNHVFSLKIYIPSSGLTGNQPNIITLKLQDGTLSSPWETQTGILKAVDVDKWQTITFDFNKDSYSNFNTRSQEPIERRDFNRVLLQVNGENNNDKVIAYIDDFYYADGAFNAPVFDKLVWSDEFDTDGPIDPDKWFHQTKFPIPGAWFNNEIQHYTNRTDNSVVEDGKLKIIAKKETFTDQGFTRNYTSARLNSKFAFTYGRVEIMAKLPRGGGTWPAMWMLGKNISENGAYWQTQGFGTTPWPDCGEIDIMEHWGTNQNHVTSATHTPFSHGGTINVGGQDLPTASDDFHLYTLDWTEDALIFAVDGKIHLISSPRQKNANTWPFDKDQYLLLNVAIQDVIEPSFVESALEIDYIRVYQQSTTGTSYVVPEAPTLIYPNLIKDEINIEFDQNINSKVPVKIYALNGVQILETVITPGNKQLSITNLDRLTAGMYLLSYEYGNRLYSGKFIKE